MRQQNFKSLLSRLNYFNPMANGTAARKHECSCGRSFRHAISLKRHQNVTGCAPSVDGESAAEPKAPKIEVEFPVPVEKEVPALAPEPVKVKPVPVASPTTAPVREVADDRTVVITPELVAAWQAQTGFQRRSVPVVDRIAPPVSSPKKEIDWAKLAGTTMEFVEFCGEVKSQAVSGVRGVLTVLAKASFFCAVMLMSGWFMVTTVSASVSVDSNDVAKQEIAAQTLVVDFLQNARLNQYQRAHDLLAPQAKASVSTQQLQMMLNSLPLNHQPSACQTSLGRDGRTAQVVLTRDGANEVYTLLRDENGWGLSSVSVANS